MLKIVICDDEQAYLDKTCAMLEQYAAENKLEYTPESFSNPSELLDRIEEGLRHDIYLLDIYMPGVSGMSIATELRAKGVQSPVIFLTSSVDHAVEAFGVDATHYLLKPYTKQNFFAAMDKAVRNISEHPRESVVLKVGSGYEDIAVSRLCYCVAEDKYQRLCLETGEKILIRMTGGELYEKLKSFGCFCRCGRAHIVNLAQIKKVTPVSAILRDGTEIHLPRTAVAGLRTAFFDYFKAGGTNR